MQKILVTGGAGFIGSHTCNRLVQSGFQVTAVDDLSTGFAEALPAQVELVKGDVLNELFMTDLMQSLQPHLVIHLAAKLNLRDSMFRPLDYYQNNVTGLLSTLRSMNRARVQKIIFSSSSAVYGDTEGHRPLVETDEPHPISPYGSSKLVCEKMLADHAKAFNLNYIILRYFNAAGAADDGANGQRTTPAYQLIQLAIQASLGRRPFIEIYGDDYPTADGTCVRDYIHIEDLADVHLLACRHLLAEKSSEIFNCGYSRGFSVREVIEAVKEVSGVSFEVRVTGRKLGESANLIANTDKIRTILGWTPRRDSLQEICRSALEWARQRESV